MSKNFVVKGRAKIGLKWERFEKIVAADRKERAVDKALSTLGGSHRVKRHQIKIDSVVEQLVSKQ
ncbi:MAG: 50S ribosomal protein L18a [Candidatus Verstraetearchaeota archaeon]|nr:50S ribosomal protein L18a [Candidatus Verstraetearchaeota archaeon]